MDSLYISLPSFTHSLDSWDYFTHSSRQRLTFVRAWSTFQKQYMKQNSENSESLHRFSLTMEVLFFRATQNIHFWHFSLIVVCSQLTIRFSFVLFPFFFFSPLSGFVFQHCSIESEICLSAGLSILPLIQLCSTSLSWGLRLYATDPMAPVGTSPLMRSISDPFFLYILFQNLVFVWG